MRQFLIVSNERRDENSIVTNKVISALNNNGISTTLISFQNFKAMAQSMHEVLKEEENGFEVAIIVGGDGTMIRCARVLRKYNLPMIGVNAGTVGFLCEIEDKNLEESLKALIKGEYYEENRMMLYGEYKVDDKISYEHALNDVVIYRHGVLRVITLNLYVDDQLLYTFKGDGIVVSTPTGSTGYSMSCGGPIVDPKAEMIVVTPIAAHDLNAKSIVLDKDAKLTIEVVSCGSEENEKVYVSFDGDQSHGFCAGDRIDIAKANEQLRLCKLRKTSFLDILSLKFQRN